MNGSIGVMRFIGGQMGTRGMIGWDHGETAIVVRGFGIDGRIAVSRATTPAATEVRYEGERVGDFNSPVQSRRPGGVRGRHQ